MALEVADGMAYLSIRKYVHRYRVNQYLGRILVLSADTCAGLRGEIDRIRPLNDRIRQENRIRLKKHKYGSALPCFSPLTFFSFFRKLLI